MAKKITEEEVVEVTTEETPVVATEIGEEVTTPVVTPSLGFLSNIRGKAVVSVEFGEVYINVKDVEGTTYKLPRDEYISLL